MTICAAHFSTANVRLPFSVPQDFQEWLDSKARAELLGEKEQSHVILREDNAEGASGTTPAIQNCLSIYWIQTNLSGKSKTVCAYIGVSFFGGIRFVSEEVRQRVRPQGSWQLIASHQVHSPGPQNANSLKLSTAEKYLGKAIEIAWCRNQSRSSHREFRRAKIFFSAR